MAGSSSSSSSSESTAKKGKKDKKNKKGKKEKKDKKKDKKAEKKAKKADKKEKKAESWQCDRREAVRLIASLLSVDAGIEDELGPVFELLDEGDVVRIDGLENKMAKKKLRHLMKAFKLSEVEGGFKTSSKNVSFTALFQGCLKEAKKVAKVPTPEFAAQINAAAAATEAAVAKYCKAPSTDAGAEGKQADSGDAAEPAAVAAPALAGPRKVGPQLPGASVGPAGGEDSSNEEDDDGDAGPRIAGEERQGVDLRDLPQQSNREEWMSTPHAAISGAFMDGLGGPRKRDKYEVQRSKEEQEAFEKAFKERGPSLLQAKMDGKFAGHEEDMERARKKKNTIPDLWGTSAKEQANGVAGAAVAAGSRKSFDPEKDMQSSKPMSGTDFSKLVENSVVGLNGRFSRGGIAASFL